MEENKEKETMSLEKAFAFLENSISQLEAEDISLEESFKIYEEGMKLVKYCNQKIDEVEQKILIINEKGDLDEF